MARQIASKSVAARHPAGRLIAARCLLPAITFSAILTALPNLRAESLASKNKEGNRLFAQGSYEDAEKAYLEAQVNSPGNPKVLYNLGNSLIKQKKYDQGIQALRQSISKGDAGIRENSWYNTGNALFSTGNFRDSAEAFIEALRLDPGDRDAKHNLELALMKQQEQRQAQSRAGNGEQRQTARKDQNGAGNPKPPVQPARPQTLQAAPREGSISKEQAIEILEAVQSQELEEQRKLLERRARQKVNGKDW
jgi:Ca-activated chloride channel family protein